MSIITFSKPSDSEILQHVDEKNQQKVSFVGNGSVRQKVNETLYVRTIKIKFKKREVLKNVVYVKKGISWLFRSIESTSSA